MRPRLWTLVRITTLWSLEIPRADVPPPDSAPAEDAGSDGSDDDGGWSCD